MRDRKITSRVGATIKSNVSRPKQFLNSFRRNKIGIDRPRFGRVEISLAIFVFFSPIPFLFRYPLPRNCTRGRERFPVFEWRSRFNRWYIRNWFRTAGQSASFPRSSVHSIYVFAMQRNCIVDRTVENGISYLISIDRFNESRVEGGQTRGAHFSKNFR